VSINSILANGLSSILTNSAALRVTSNNIANMNTPGYVRRVVQQETQTPGGVLGGVTLGDVTRAVNDYFGREVTSAQGDFSQYDVQSTLMDQLNGALGKPGDGLSLSTRLDNVYAALGQASLDPSLLANRQGALYQFGALAQTVSDLSDSLSGLRQSADQQIGVTVDEANRLIKEIYDMNLSIQKSVVGGDTASGLLDQRDEIVNELSKLIGIRTIAQSDGRLYISTTDGMNLIGDTYAQLGHMPSAGPSFHPLTIQMLDGRTGNQLGSTQTFDSRVDSGELRGLLDARDELLADLGGELGAFAQTLALAYNEQHNANSAVPPPVSMTGRETGLLDTDTLNFTGNVTIGIADAGGTLQHRVAVDFNLGTVSFDGGLAASIGTTIGSFTAALDTALGGSGSATFVDGVLKLSATGGSGLVVAGDPGDPAKRAGTGFSQFFGLNDLFHTAAQSITNTGLTSTDTGGFVGGTMALLLKGPDGQRVNETTVTFTGTTIGDMVAELNTAFSGKATFVLDANGKLNMTSAAGYQDYTLDVRSDSTARGTTGESFSSLFGLGESQSIMRAQGFSISTNIANAPQRLAFAQASLTPTSVLGTQIVGSGDNRGLLALQGLSTKNIAFSSGGALPGRTTTLGDYAATFYQDVSARGQLIESSRTAQNTRLAQAQKNESQSEGVNIDEELSNMMMLQQAYNAGARLIKVADELYDQLLNIV
jgi:flagellar hook-associated protein 1 FlgK